MKKFTIDQIIKILAEADIPGNSVAAIAKKYGISKKLSIAGTKIPWFFLIRSQTPQSFRIRKCPTKTTTCRKRTRNSSLNSGNKKISNL